MEDLPYSIRRRPTRDCGPPTSHGAFGDIKCHTPLNRQVTSPRPIQTGTFRSRDIKSQPRIIDSRMDQIDRNRENLLFNSTFDRVRTSYQSSRSTFSPPTTKRLTSRHDFTPFDYSTEWISHPSQNTSLFQNAKETFQTSYLATPNSDIDKQNMKISREQKYNYLRSNIDHHQAYLNEINTKQKSIDEMNKRNIRMQRNDYIEALNLRHKYEIIDPIYK